MDIRCRRCGEPWDNDTIHEEVAERAYLGEETTYSEVAAEFRAKGCQAFRVFTGNDQPCKRTGANNAEAAGVLADLLGDDMDGAAALLEDFEMGF